MKKSRKGTVRLHAGIWAAVAALLLAGAPTSALATPGNDHGQGAAHRSARATAALDAAKALFVRHEGSTAAGGPARRTRATAVVGDATAVLRDLATGLDDLDASQRRVALRILARPTDGSQESWPGIKYHGAPSTDSCTAGFATHVCVHWVTDPTDVNAPEQTDLNKNGVPDWVERNQQVLEEVWQREVVGLGYRPPADDSAVTNHGKDGRLDVYLADLGQYGMYGYCAAEPPVRRSTAPAYCVLDNDYAEFPGKPLNDLKVTAAHEFFHAVQYAYNVYADTWLMEGTAAWIEDEVYDSINDNLQYLALSPLEVPEAPLDYAGVDNPNRPNDVNWRYGSWIWWRFLSEHFGRGRTEDPSIVRQVWQRLAVNGGASMPAVRTVLASRRTSFAAMFADFGAATRVAPRWYSEGWSYAKYVGPPTGAFTLTKSRRDSGWRGTTLDHFSTLQDVIRPGSGLMGRWRLRVDVNLPPRFKGSEARVLVQRRDGRFSLLRVWLNPRGDGRAFVPFGSGSIARVSVSLTNASTRFIGCGSGEPFSCGGLSRDDGGRYLLRARVVR